MSLKLHEPTYERLQVQKPAIKRLIPTVKSYGQLRFGKGVASPKVITQAVADAGAQMDILSLAELNLSICAPVSATKQPHGW